MKPRSRASLTHEAWIAGLTGLHFAVLQIGLLLSVQSVASSAWTTYAALTQAWLGGSLIGLWIRIPRALTILLGVLTFLGAVGGTQLWPWSPYTLICGILSAGVGGLWAGGFFLQAARRKQSPSRIFFHENNGFALGLILTASLFAFGGRHLLLVAPCVTATLILFPQMSSPRIDEAPHGIDS